jgi:hypothetical protein
MRIWTRFNWIKMGSYAEDRRPSGYIKYVKFLSSTAIFIFSRRTLANGFQTCNIPVPLLYEIAI